MEKTCIRCMTTYVRRMDRQGVTASKGGGGALHYRVYGISAAPPVRWILLSEKESNNSTGFPAVLNAADAIRGLTL